MGRVRDKIAETEVGLLRAAATLFRDKGFAATTVREIAKAADMLPGSLHYRFASKESILLALMDYAVEQATEAVDAAISSTHDPVEKLRLGVKAHLKLLLSGDDAVFVLLNEWRALSGEAREAMVALRDRYEDFWDALMAEAVRAGRFRRDVDVKLLRLLGFGAVNSSAQWYQPGGRLSVDDIADAAWNILAVGAFSEEERVRWALARAEGGSR
ncbi:MAG: TetR/AcrR family transcriptional regulator [Deltaproteobacteria bacterium]|nr:TetR/AcrR family transcriptional regulator [Deltaproteobacteria bacterium]